MIKVYITRGYCSDCYTFADDEWKRVARIVYVAKKQSLNKRYRCYYMWHCDDNKIDRLIEERLNYLLERGKNEN